MPAKVLGDRHYGTYEYFGEVAIITGQERQADVVAETDVIAYSVGRDEFLDFIEGTEFQQTLVRLAKVRSSDSWNLLSASSLFRYCSSYQKTWLESILVPVQKTGKGVLVREGERLECIYIVRKGVVYRSRGGESTGTLRRGDYVGNLTRMYRRAEALCTYTHNGPVSLYAINWGLPEVRREESGLAHEVFLYRIIFTPGDQPFRMLRKNGYPDCFVPSAQGSIGSR